MKLLQLMTYKQARLILLGMAYDFLKGQELLSDMIYTPLRGVGIIRRLKTGNEAAKLFFVMQK